MAATNQQLTGATRLRAMLQGEKIILVPGIYDGFTARLAIEAGFDILYVTGAGTSMSRLGMADLGLATMNDMSQNAGMIAGLERSIPVIADADTGYGGPLMVRRTVEEYIKAGVASLHLEDQVQTKRCGHLGSKELVDEDVYISRIRAAALARDQMPNGDIVIIARTDALQSLGYDVAVARLKKAVAAGADIAFLEAPTSIDQMRAVVRDLAPTPVLLNMVSGGCTPDVTTAEAEQIGFKMIVFPTLALAPVYESVTEAAKILKKTGTVKPTAVMAKGPKALFEVCGLHELMAFDISAGSVSFENGV
jgi:2-methylisocitrate lyase-like PEP mutase family enzyme